MPHSTVFATFTVNYILKSFNHDVKKVPYHDANNRERVLEFTSLSLKMRTILKSQRCKNCGIEGNVFKLESDYTECSPHLNLYYVLNDKIMMLTCDHIIPKSKGGLNVDENTQTLCRKCNIHKGSKIQTKYFTDSLVNKIRFQPRYEKLVEKLDKKLSPINC